MLYSADTTFPHETVARRGHETPRTTRRRILDATTFRRVLDHERARCDRSGLAFSVVAFDVDKTAAGRDMESTIQVLARRVRSIDEIGWMHDGRLAALLPYVGAEEAWSLSEEVLSLLSLRDAPPGCEVFTYPSNWPAVEAEDTPDPRPLEPLFARPLPWWKRLIDVLGAGMGLFLLAPVMVILAVAIKCTSPGPAFFTQLRTGLGGRRFRMLKFRTMSCNAESLRELFLASNEQDGPAFKLTNDPRVTKFGRWLRITSLDEIPQLWNVLKGEMSLVGPRPLPCIEAEACQVWQRRRHDVTPGITCIWQAGGRKRESFDDWMRQDMEYANKRSPWMDLKLLAQTIPAVLKNRIDR